ncbi:hypothetical protein CCACVL1_17028 [Corchorus capsularis]|uniref:Uncharacterized protein n=1 Tax=Corchorus capsularis TaxID=210143 RepID=A0A1R3HUD5_COCAP|nr:hypothetical protein CCACVL1_17028 [Corchorus capsularis]
MGGQRRVMNGLTIVLLFSTLLVISKTQAHMYSLRGLKLTSSFLGGMEMKTPSSPSLKTMERSGPSPNGPGHKSRDELSPNGYGPRKEQNAEAEGLLHFSRIHHH